jgi:hypothetical protein
MDVLDCEKTSNDVSNRLRRNVKFRTRRNGLAVEGKSCKEVYLPDNTKLQATYWTQLPLKQLSQKAREAGILPELKTPLVSVNKMAEEGYTTIFHPGEEGVTAHKQGTVSITMTEPPVLQGCKAKGAKLWTISADNSSKKGKRKQSVRPTFDQPNSPIPTCSSGLSN